MAHVSDEKFWGAVRGVLAKDACGECPVCTPEELAAYAEGRLRGRPGHVLRAHLQNCWKCYEIVTELRREINSKRFGAGSSIGRQEDRRLGIYALARPPCCRYSAASEPQKAVPVAARRPPAHGRLRGPGRRWAAAAVPAALVLAVTLIVSHQTTMLGPFCAPMAGGRYPLHSAYGPVGGPPGPTTSEEQAQPIPTAEASRPAGPAQPASREAPEGETAPARTGRDSVGRTAPAKTHLSGPPLGALAPGREGQDAGGNHGGGEAASVENGGNGSLPMLAPPSTEGPLRAAGGDEEGTGGDTGPYVSPEHSLARRWQQAGGDTSQFSLRELQELHRQYPRDKRILRGLIARLEEAVAKGDISVLPRLQ